MNTVVNNIPSYTINIICFYLIYGVLQERALVKSNHNINEFLLDTFCCRGR